METFEELKKEFYKEKDDILTFIKEHRRKQNTYGINDFQEFREELSFKFLNFGEGVVAELRFEAERAVVSRKVCYEAAKQAFLEEHAGKRGMVGKAESQAVLDCEDAMNFEVNTNRYYQRAREFSSGVSEVLNAASSRIKILLKE